MTLIFIKIVCYNYLGYLIHTDFDFSRVAHEYLQKMKSSEVKTKEEKKCQ